jgi:hypothetical protein
MSPIASRKVKPPTYVARILAELDEIDIAAPACSPRPVSRTPTHTTVDVHLELRAKSRRRHLGTLGRYF